MIQEILETWKNSPYDFRTTANPNDPLRHLFNDWVQYYRLKWAISRALKPVSILEVGVRFGYSAMAFMNGWRDAAYLGIDVDGDTLGTSKGALDWARHALHGLHADFVVADSQQMTRFPGGIYDLIHVDGQKDGAASFHDLKLALAQAKWILLDGYFWSKEKVYTATSFLEKFRDLIEYAAVVPGYAGELLIKVKEEERWEGSSRPNSSEALRATYDSRYYLCDCGGYETYKRTGGKSIEDIRLRAVAALAELARPSRVLDLGCGRGELVHYFASTGAEVVGVDYSEKAIALAGRCFDDEPELRQRAELVCGDVCLVPLEGFFEAVTASDVIEHLGPTEVDHLYERVARVLAPEGVFVIHTFPNLWFYKYDYRRRRRLAQRQGSYLEPEPRTRYELSMHINEQSPREMLRQLRAHFPHVLLWFGDPSAPLGNLGSKPNKDFVRAAPSLFAIASHRLVRIEEITPLFRMYALNPLPQGTLRLTVCSASLQIATYGDFQVQVEIENQSENRLQSLPPFPVSLAYHWFDEGGSIRVFDGERTPLVPPLASGMHHRYGMRVSAPGTTGRWTLRVTLVQDGVRWFDEPPTSLWADVTAHAAD